MTVQNPRSYRLGAAVAAALLVMVHVASATPVSPGGALSPLVSMIYTAPDAPAPGMWSVGTTMGASTILKASGVGNQFLLKSGEVTFSWTGNQLDQDLSHTQPGGGSLAEATFLGGGTLTLAGKIRDATSPLLVKPILFDGALLTATVGSFHLQEDDGAGNSLSSVGTTIRFIPTAGYLYTNTILQLQGEYQSSIVLASVGILGGGDLGDFQSNLIGLTSFMMNLTQVPEPSSALLVGLGILALRTRRSRRG